MTTEAIHTQNSIEREAEHDRGYRFPRLRGFVAASAAILSLAGCEPYYGNPDSACKVAVNGDSRARAIQDNLDALLADDFAFTYHAHDGRTMGELNPELRDQVTNSKGKPDVVVDISGQNDVAYDTDYQPDLAERTDILQGVPKVVVVATNEMGNAAWGKAEASQAFNEDLRSIIATNPGRYEEATWYAETSPSAGREDPDDPETPPLFYIDGIHTLEAGEELMAEDIANHVTAACTALESE